MSWSKPLTPEEETFIRESFGQLSPSDIAARLGRSKRGVNNAIRRMGLRERHARAEVPDGGESEPVPPEAPQPTEPDRLTDLLELRGILRAALLDAGPQSIPKVAREYRETIEEIERIRGGGDSSPGDADPLGDVLALVPVRL